MQEAFSAFLGFPERKEKEKEAERFFKQIIAENSF